MPSTSGDESGGTREDRGAQSAPSGDRDIAGRPVDNILPAQGASSSQVGEYTYATVDKLYYLEYAKYAQYEQLTDQAEKRDFIINNSYKVEETDSTNVPTVTR